MNFKLMAALLYVVGTIVGLYIVANTLETSTYPIFFFIVSCLVITSYVVYKHGNQISNNALLILNLVSLMNSVLWGTLIFAINGDYQVSENSILVHKPLLYILLLVSIVHVFYLLYERCRKAIAWHKAGSNRPLL